MARSDAESARAEAKEARRHTDYVIAVVKVSDGKNAAAKAAAEAEAAAEGAALRRRVDTAEADNRELRLRLDESRRQLTTEAHARAAAEAAAAAGGATAGATTAAAEAAAAAVVNDTAARHTAAAALDADDRLRADLMARFESAMGFAREVESEPVPTLKTSQTRKSTKSKKQGQNQNRHPNDNRMDDDYRCNTPREYVRIQSEKEARVSAAEGRYTTSRQSHKETRLEAMRDDNSQGPTVTPREHVRKQSHKEVRAAAAEGRYTRDDSAMKKDFAVGTDG